jgi:hypothetical protein
MIFGMLFALACEIKLSSTGLCNVGSPPSKPIVRNLYSLEMEFIHRSAKGKSITFEKLGEQLA